MVKFNFLGLQCPVETCCLLSEGFASEQVLVIDLHLYCCRSRNHFPCVSVWFAWVFYCFFFTIICFLFLLYVAYVLFLCGLHVFFIVLAIICFLFLLCVVFGMMHFLHQFTMSSDVHTSETLGVKTVNPRELIMKFKVVHNVISDIIHFDQNTVRSNLKELFKI